MTCCKFCIYSQPVKIQNLQHDNDSMKKIPIKMSCPMNDQYPLCIKFDQIHLILREGFHNFGFCGEMQLLTFILLILKFSNCDLLISS